MASAFHSNGRKRVAVIGAGPAGLVALKELKEKGHIVTAFEKRSTVGGTFTDPYAGLQLTSSSAVTSFGSFMGGDPARPVIWRSDEYVEYLTRYAHRYELMPHLRLGTAVRTIRRAPGGGWRLVAVHADDRAGNGASRDAREMTVDHIVICSGPSVRPRLPEWADPKAFDGRICHSSEVRSEAEFTGKRVLLVGMGESGSDLALMAARVAKSVAISTRKGPGYIIPRTYRGLPTDLDTNRCYHSLPRSIMNRPIVRFKVRIEDALPYDDHDLAVLRKCGEINRARGASPFHRFGTKSTGFVEAIVHHGATYHPAPAALERDRVVFADGTAFPCDVIVCCTGFAPEFPFLQEHEPDLAKQASKPRALYKRMIVPDAGTSIAWVGFVRPGLGSVPPCAEMQARYLAQLISGERALPSKAEMSRDIRMHAEIDMEQYPDDAERVATLTDFYRFMETMADVIRCRPPIGRLFLRDPRTAFKVMFGPLSAAQYRLVGPGADPQNARATLRRLPTMPWPVLGYELLMWLGAWTFGLMREEWRRARVADAPAAAGPVADVPVTPAPVADASVADARITTFVSRH